MYNKKLLKCEIISFIIFSVIGTLAHFFYEWSGENSFVAYLSPVNESIWEHLKILFFPGIVLAIFEYFCIGKKYKNFIFHKAIAIYISMIVTTMLYYTYTGIIGHQISVVNIIIFFIASATNFIYTYFAAPTSKEKYISLDVIGVFLLVVALFAFIVFTNSPPTLGIFLDPSTQKYGKANSG